MTTIFHPSSTALLVKLAARPDFTGIESMPRGPARKSAAWEAIQRTAEHEQAPFLQKANKLLTNGAITGYLTLASPDMLIVQPAKGQERNVRTAFSVPGVAAIYDNDHGEQVWPPVNNYPTPVGSDRPGIVSRPSWGYDVDVEKPIDGPYVGTTYGVSMIGAPEAWGQGADGHGLVFGSVDSGADVNHEALHDAYRGTQSDGTIVNDYSWADMSDQPSPSPVDERGHGTHVIGSVVGHTDSAHIGVAPAAKWISARGTTGQPDAALRALQWMQAPTRVDGTDAKADKAPDVVGLSWFMGSAREELFRDSIQNLRAAGIEVVKSAGNFGPDPKSISSPGQYPELWAIGSVDASGTISPTSSRGPALVPRGKPAPKPDFAAPGVDVISSLPGNRYGSNSGTSMAQPHFSGAVLDLLSLYPQLTHDQLTQALATGAIDAGPPGRDMTYGRGIIDIPEAIAAASRLVTQTRVQQPVAA